MLEKEIKQQFITTHIDTFKNYVKSPQLRVYAIELPLSIETSTYYADIVLINENKKLFNDMQMIVLEFKKSKIDYGPIDQLHMYVENIHKKYYRRTKTSGILVAPKFSKHELEQCQEYGYHALLLDDKFNMKFLI